MMQDKPTTLVQLQNKERLKSVNITIEKGSTYFNKQFNSETVRKSY